MPDGKALSAFCLYGNLKATKAITRQNSKLQDWDKVVSETARREADMKV